MDEADEAKMIEFFKSLNEKEKEQLLHQLEFKRKEEEIRQAEYNLLRSRERMREVPFRSATPEGEMVNNLDDLHYIDQNTRLTTSEINALFRFDTMVKMGIYPPIPLSDIYKRLKVSEQGKGRTEKVNIVTGTRSRGTEDNTGFLQKMFARRKLEAMETGGKKDE